MPMSANRRKPARRLPVRLAIPLLVLCGLGASPGQAEHAATLDSPYREVTEVAPPGYDNDLLGDTLCLPAERRMGHQTPFEAWRARTATGSDQERVIGVVLPVVTGRGYHGDISLVVGIDAEGAITGARVTDHHETQGLGDAIETRRSDWIRQFDGRSLDDPAGGWALRGDGGEFDGLSGATVTARAVVSAVHQALCYFDLHRERLLAPDAERAAP
ncbi:electron transport complex protein RnfG [Halomonas campaniensis]|uniref:Electron transport complex protein RnfG n=1 Tax=Halomonas campaniensis TaxID=213554 RepID=A0A7W5JZX0_9GAMM|nr:RnfABCDGE type electron transport complex subunit G [Halomonas campaniensis]MBB3329231.1 electron transport complex protein RnfG [Halomonas campaniensis]